MTGKIRRIDDEMVEILSQLSSMSAPSAKLTDALRNCDSAATLNSARAAQQAIAKVARDLGEFSGGAVSLLETRSKQGSFATDACRALQPALAKIVEERRSERDRDLRLLQLEWLRLSTCLDRQPLRIGAYQAHAERFVGCAIKQLISSFPWIDCKLHIEEDRSRSDRFTGKLRRLFDGGKFDYILVPRESEQEHLRKVYTYSFRVIGHPACIDRLKARNNTISVRGIAAIPLIVAPAGASSRRRVQEMFLDEGIDINSSPFQIIEEANPAVMRIRAETGEGVALMSDEYSAVGGSSLNFPYLVKGAGEEYCQVDMGLLMYSRPAAPRHDAFEFIVQRLVEAETIRERVAAQT